MKNKINLTVVLLIVSVLIITSFIIVCLGGSHHNADDYTVSEEEAENYHLSGSFDIDNYADEGTDENLDDEGVEESDEDWGDVDETSSEDLDDETVEDFGDVEEASSGVDTAETEVLESTGITEDNYLGEMKAILECNFDSNNIDETYKEQLESNPVVDPYVYEVTGIEIIEDDCSFEDKVVSAIVDTTSDTLVKSYKFTLNFNNKITNVVEIEQEG